MVWISFAEGEDEGWEGLGGVAIVAVFWSLVQKSNDSVLNYVHCWAGFYGRSFVQLGQH